MPKAATVNTSRRQPLAATVDSRQPLAAIPSAVGAYGETVLQRWKYGQLPHCDADIKRRARETMHLVGEGVAEDFLPDWKLQTVLVLMPPAVATQVVISC